MAARRAATARRPSSSSGRHGSQAKEPDAPVDVVVRIRALMPSLAPAEQRVARLAVSDPGRAARWTISEYAERAQTSGTTIIRFCRAIGLDGYPALRIALAATAGHSAAGTWRSVSGDIAPDDDIATVVQKVGHADARAVEDTIGQIDVDLLGRVVDAVINARRIDVYGVGASGLVALDLQQKLHRVGHAVFAWQDPHIAVTSASLLRRGDVAIGISHSGATADTVESLAEARRRRAVTVAITNFPGSPISRVADHVLTTAARETTFRSGAMASRIAALTVVDSLFVAVAQRNYADTLQALERTYTAVNSRR